MKNTAIDPKNDIVLTPNYIADFMCKIADVNSKSIVADVTAGDGSLLLAAHKYGAEKLIGVEYEGFMYNRLLDNMKANNVDDSTNIFICGDGLAVSADLSEVNVLLLNPPYSAEGKGFNFAYNVIKEMKTGTAVILTMENAGRGNGIPYTKKILKHATLKASVKLPRIFKGFAEVDVALFIFQCGRSHDIADKVLFLDMSNDGYQRSGKKSQKGTVKNVDHADERYSEALERIHGNTPQTSFYANDSIYDTINLDGEDWTYSAHKVVDLTPTEEDFKKTVADYLEFKCKQALMDRGLNTDYPYTLAAVKNGVISNKKPLSGK